jgi:nicotinate phosphoribosyltransferase
VRALTGGLVTDLYELNMAASYLRRRMSGPATFSLFVRQLPLDRGFLVAAGLEDCLAFLEGFGFDEGELAGLADTLGFDRATVEAFGRLRFTGDVWAVPEGRVVFAGEPLLEVTAPIAEAQLVETALLNQVTFQTAVASKAARCRLAAGGAELVDFAFRRTQGIDAAMAVAAARRWSGSRPPATPRRRAASGCAPPAPWPTPTWRRSPTSRPRSAPSPRTSRAAPPSWSTPTTPSAASAPRSR